MSQSYSIPVYKVQLVRETGIPVAREEVITPTTAARIALSHMEGVDREHFLVMLLDARNHVIGINTVSVGTLSGAMVHPREVFKSAIPSNAHSVLLIHNHPSGGPWPSPDDTELFARMREAGRMIGIKVHDALILSQEEHYSAASGCTFSLAQQ